MKRLWPRITASEFGVILGTNPYRNYEKKYEDISREQIEHHLYKVYGEKYEDTARKQYIDKCVYEDADSKFFELNYITKINFPCFSCDAKSLGDTYIILSIAMQKYNISKNLLKHLKHKMKKIRKCHSENIIVKYNDTWYIKKEYIMSYVFLRDLR